MDALMMVLILAAVTIVAVWIGERTKLPYPVLLVLGTIAMAFIPQTPDFSMDPDLILPIFLPPLIFAVARKISWSVFVRNWRTLLILSLLLTAVSAFAVAGAVMWLVPGIGMPVALALGAMVAPTDPVALEAVAEPAKVPRGIMRALQSEGLFNDAVGIVLYSVALSFASSQSEGSGAWAVLGYFLASTVGAIAVGYVVGWIVSLAIREIHSPAATGAVTMIAPFVAYLGAEHAHASGVIAVVVAALEINRREVAHASEGRLLTSSFWEVVDLLVVGVAFGLMGFELRGIVNDEGWTVIWDGAGIALAVVAILVAVRLFFMLVLYKVNKGRTPKDWRDVVILVWCGMRALFTLALALALPAASSGEQWAQYRSLTVAVAAIVLIIMLVPGGLALPWLIGKIRPVEDKTAVDEEREILAARVRSATMQAIDSYVESLDLSPEQRERLEHWNRQFGPLMPAIPERHPSMYGQANALGSMVPLLAGTNSAHRMVEPGGREYRGEEFTPAEREEFEKRAEVVSAMMNGAQAAVLDAARAAVLDARNDPTIDVAIVEEFLLTLDRRAQGMEDIRKMQRRRASSGARGSGFGPRGRSGMNARLARILLQVRQAEEAASAQRSAKEPVRSRHTETTGAGTAALAQRRGRLTGKGKKRRDDADKVRYSSHHGMDCEE